MSAFPELIPCAVCGSRWPANVLDNFQRCPMCGLDNKTPGGAMNDEMQELIDTGKLSLESTVRDGDEMLPILLVEAADGTIIVVGLAGGHPYDVLAASLPMLQEMRPRKLSLTTDTYMILGRIEDVGEVERVRARYRNSLQAAFQAGEPSVSEALCFHIVTPTDSSMVMAPYKRLPKRRVEWGDSTPLPNQAEGRMIDVLRAVFASAS